MRERTHKQVKWAHFIEYWKVASALENEAECVECTCPRHSVGWLEWAWLRDDICMRCWDKLRWMHILGKSIPGRESFRCKEGRLSGHLRNRQEAPEGREGGSSEFREGM